MLGLARRTGPDSHPEFIHWENELDSYPYKAARYSEALLSTCISSWPLGEYEQMTGSLRLRGFQFCRVDFSRLRLMRQSRWAFGVPEPGPRRPVSRHHPSRDDG